MTKCKYCGVPLDGLMSVLPKYVFGIEPSTRYKGVCNKCESMASKKRTRRKKSKRRKSRRKKSKRRKKKRKKSRRKKSKRRKSRRKKRRKRR